jgi:hypothetical protein
MPTFACVELATPLQPRLLIWPKWEPHVTPEVQRISAHSWPHTSEPPCCVGGWPYAWLASRGLAVAVLQDPVVTRRCTAHTIGHGCKAASWNLHHGAVNLRVCRGHTGLMSGAGGYPLTEAAFSDIPVFVMWYLLCYVALLFLFLLLLINMQGFVQLELVWSRAWLEPVLRARTPQCYVMCCVS